MATVKVSRIKLIERLEGEIEKLEKELKERVEANERLKHGGEELAKATAEYYRKLADRVEKDGPALQVVYTYDHHDGGHNYYLAVPAGWGGARPHLAASTFDGRTEHAIQNDLERVKKLRRTLDMMVEDSVPVNLNGELGAYL